MSRELALRNRQRSWRVDLPAVRAWTHHWLGDGLGLGDWELGVTLVSAPAMARLNRRWLDHAGSTDIITFDHRSSPHEPLHGELFISVDDAVSQAAEFGTTPSSELLRYVIHGVLHLQGHDDREPRSRARMKREEDRWVRWLGQRVGKGRLVHG